MREPTPEPAPVELGDDPVTEYVDAPGDDEGDDTDQPGEHGTDPAEDTSDEPTP